MKSLAAYFGNKYQVLSLTDSLGLAFDPWGNLSDVLKDDESLTVELKFPVMTQQLLKDLKKETSWFSYISSNTADDQDAVTQISVKDRITALKINSGLKKSMHCTRNTIYLSKDFQEPIYTISGSAQAQTWFIRLEFYQKDVSAEKFEIWFPHRQSYEYGLETLKDSQTLSQLNKVGKFKILEENIVQDAHLANQESRVFWGNQCTTSKLAKGAESKNLVIRNDISYRLVCTYVPNSTQFFCENFIREAIGSFLQGTDFLVMIRQIMESPFPQEVNVTAMQNSFDQKFKEFVMKPNVEYQTFEGFRTPIILLRTSDTQDYRTVFLPCHSYFGPGQMVADFKYFDGLRDFTTFCYSSLGRIGESTILTKACTEFKTLLLDCRNSLRISATPQEDSNQTSLQYYFSFNDSAATVENRKLATILSPIAQTVSTLGVSVNSEMKREIGQEIFEHALKASDDVWEFNEMEGKLTFSVYSRRQWTQLHLAVRDIVKSLQTPNACPKSFHGEGERANTLRHNTNLGFCPPIRLTNLGREPSKPQTHIGHTTTDASERCVSAMERERVVCAEG